MSGERDAVFEWAESGRLEAGHVAEALCVAGAIPGAVEWRRFVDRLLLGLAVVLAGAGVVFFVAANWQELGRFAKFALVELAIVLALVAVWRFELVTRAGQAASSPRRCARERCSRWSGRSTRPAPTPGSSSRVGCRDRHLGRRRADAGAVAVLARARQHHGRALFQHVRRIFGFVFGTP